MKLEEKLSDWIGSWSFVVWQTTFIIVWVIFNLTPFAFDPFPFIFLNLMLSLQATYTVPILMIHSNKMEQLDRESAQQNNLDTKTILDSIKKLEKNLIVKIEEVEDAVEDAIDGK